MLTVGFMEFFQGFGWSWEHVGLLLLAGFLVGIINTFAGSGTVITYYLFMALGLSVGESNGTNRMGVVAQTLSTSWIFFKKNLLEVRTGLILSIPTVVGTVFGALVAVRIPEKVLQNVVGFLMLGLVFTVFLKPEHWLNGRTRKSGPEGQKFTFLHACLYFVIGFYGGFIHIGVGIFLLAALVLVSGFDLLKANALKVFIVFVYSPFALGIFMWNGQVAYEMALISSVGNLLGGMWAAQLSVRLGTVFLRWILTIVILLFTADLFGVYKWLGSLLGAG